MAVGRESRHLRMPLAERRRCQPSCGEHRLCLPPDLGAIPRADGPGAGGVQADALLRAVVAAQAESATEY